MSRKMKISLKATSHNDIQCELSRLVRNIEHEIGLNYVNVICMTFRIQELRNYVDGLKTKTERRRITKAK